MALAPSAPSMPIPVITMQISRSPESLAAADIMVTSAAGQNALDLGAGFQFELGGTLKHQMHPARRNDEIAAV
jgi:hypothetical protein